MERAYTICIIIGLGVPLVTLILSGLMDFLDGIFDGLASIFDGFSLDLSFSIGDTNICLLPISMQSICAGLLIYGVAGKMLFTGHNYVFANLIAGACGYAVAVAIQTLIHKLKTIENTTYSIDQLMLFDTTVVNTIIAGGYGSISIKTPDGITTNYPAKSIDPALPIKQDTKVNILHFEKNVAIVEISDLAYKYTDITD